jgi:hypothetical protein
MDTQDPMSYGEVVAEMIRNMPTENLTLIRKMIFLVLMSKNYTYTQIRYMSDEALYQHIEQLYTGSLNMSMTILLYVYLRTAHRQYAWSIYHEGSQSFLMGRRTSGGERYDKMIHRWWDADMSMHKNIRLVCSADDALSLFNHNYVVDYGHARDVVLPIPSMIRIDDILSRHTSNSVEVTNRLLARGSMYDKILDRYSLSIGEYNTIIGDIISYKTLNVYEEVFKKFPNIGCYTSPVEISKRFVPDIDFVFSS